MSSDLKLRLSNLLRDYATTGCGPFAARVRERGLEPNDLTDRELRNHLSMAYGALLGDLRSAGLSAFYIKDMAVILGKERALRVLEAVDDRRVNPPRRLSPWKAWTAVIVVLLIGLQINHFVTMQIWRPRIAAMQFGSQEWVDAFKSDNTPEDIREEMLVQASESLDRIPLYSELWSALGSNPDLPTHVDEQMDALEDAQSARLAEQERRQKSAAQRRCARLGDSWSQYECMGKLGVWRDVERTARIMAGEDPSAPSTFPDFR